MVVLRSFPPELAFRKVLGMGDIALRWNGYLVVLVSRQISTVIKENSNLPLAVGPSGCIPVDLRMAKSIYTLKGERLLAV